MNKLWEKLKEKSKTKIKEFKNNNQYKVSFKSKYIGFAVLSDVHLGGEMVDYEQAEKDAKLIANTKDAYAIIGGDTTDNFINAKMVSALIESTTNIEQQIELYEYYISLFKGKVIGSILGNHNEWTKLKSGFNIFGYIDKKNRIFHAPYDLLLTFKLGKQDYKLYLRHKYRFKSSYNLTHAVKQMFRFSEYDFDIGMLEHYHEPAFEKFMWKGKQRVAVANGTYKVADDYARKLGYGINPVIQHFIILHREKREIEVFDTIETGIKYLKFLNGEKNESKNIYKR